MRLLRHLTAAGALAASLAGLAGCAQPGGGSHPQHGTSTAPPGPTGPQMDGMRDMHGTMAGRSQGSSTMHAANAPTAYTTARAQYLGWRVFQTHCARCHGIDATGGNEAPDLRPRVAPMSEARFVSAVLRRYAWVMPAAEAAREGAAREALIDDVMRRRKGELAMPAWGGEPLVEAHIADLYAYLSSLADGTLGPGRPPPPPSGR